jgi:hypothetical protein
LGGDVRVGITVCLSKDLMTRARLSGCVHVLEKLSNAEKEDFIRQGFG